MAAAEEISVWMLAVVDDAAVTKWERTADPVKAGGHWRGGRGAPDTSAWEN